MTNLLKLAVYWILSFSIIVFGLLAYQNQQFQLNSVLGTTDVTFDVLAGTLTLDAPTDATLTNVTSSFTNQNTTGSFGAITVEDARGSGVGWTLNLSSTDFTCCGGSGTIDVTNLTVTPGSITVNAGTNDATAGSAHTFASTVDQTTILSAGGGEGLGSYTINPGLELVVPSGSDVGSYTATLTTTLL